MPNRIFIYGAPGAGKTTFSEHLKAKLGYPLVEADYLREAVAQKEKTIEEDPFVHVGTKEAWQLFGNLTQENAAKGLKEVRRSMAPYVERELTKYPDSLIMEAAFLDPEQASRHGQLVLVTTQDESQHKSQYFQHRDLNDDQLEKFTAARMIQEYLLQEAEDLLVTIVENNGKVEEMADNLKTSIWLRE